MGPEAEFERTLATLRGAAPRRSTAAPGIRGWALLALSFAIPPVIVAAAPAAAAACIALPVLLGKDGAAFARKAGWALAAAIVLGVAASFKAGRSWAAPAVLLERRRHPRLFELIEAAAAATGAPAPEAVALALEPGLAVQEARGGWLGLFGRRQRILSLDASCLAGLTVDELASSLCYQLARFGPGESGVGRRLERTSAWLARLRQNLRASVLWFANPVLWAAACCQCLFECLYSAVARDRERAAREAAAALLGSEARAECAHEQAAEAGAAGPFFFGERLALYQTELSRHLAADAAARRGRQVGLRGMAASPDEGRVHAPAVSLPKIRTELWAVRLAGVAAGFLLTAALTVLAWGGEVLGDSRWELTVSALVLAVALVWALRSRRCGLIAGGDGLERRGAFSSRQLRWSQVRAVRMGVFSTRVLGRQKDRTVTFTLPAAGKEREAEMLDAILERAPALAAIAWGTGLARAAAPPDSPELWPRSVRFEAEEWRIEGPFESFFRFGPRFPRFEEVQAAIRARLVARLLDAVR